MRRHALIAALVIAAGPAAAAPRRLAILELTDEAGLGTATVRFLADRVRGEAAALPRDDWMVLTGENVLALLPPGTQLADCVGECAVETARKLDADAVVSGVVRTVAGELKLTLRLHEARGGALLAQEVAAAPDAPQLEAQVVTAARRLLGRLPVTERGRASLRVVAPDGVSVRVNGVGVPPHATQPLDAGRNLVELESRCHQPLRVPVDLTPGESRTLDLAPPPRMARLRVDALTPDGAPVAAEVHVDGQHVGDTPGEFRIPLCAGTIEVRGAGATWRHALALDAEGVTGLTATLGARRLPAATAAQSGDRSSAPAWLMVGGATAVALGGAYALANRKDGAALQDNPHDEDLRRSVDTSYRLSMGLYVGGGIAVATGLVWWLVRPGDAGPGVAVGPDGVTVGGAW